MKRNNLISAVLLLATGTVIGGIGIQQFETIQKRTNTTPAKSSTQQPVASSTEMPAQPPANDKKPAGPAKCVFKTAFEGEGITDNMIHPIPEKVVRSMDRGLDWMEKAQQNDGGWGAGSNTRQDVRDPHAVPSDPATTAMVAMALQRSGNTLNTGAYSSNLKNALEFLLEAVETSPQNSNNITTLTYTQPQSKLGQNIDVVLTSQFLTNIIDVIPQNDQLHGRVERAIQKCVNKIQNNHNSDGSLKGSGWAGVLQSSFATSALESAQEKGVEVDEVIIEKSRDYQKSNIDVKTNNVSTESAAGVVLYSVSGSTRASAKETRQAKDIIKKAKKEGKISNEEVNVDNLTRAGLSQSQALKYETAYQVNESAKKLAQDDNVLSGFGNNGGEEFLSYLQTGEGMIISNDNSWQSWYEKTSSRLLDIQNNDGSWSGHHCITSPVFCTATCLLILSVNNDIQKLTGDFKKKNN